MKLTLKRLGCLLLALTLGAGLLATAALAAEDEPLVERHEAYLTGYEDGTIRPNGTLSRAETAAILYRLWHDPDREPYRTTTNEFTDVPADAWYNEAVSTLENAGFLADYQGSFRPNEPITRAELAMLLARFWRLELELPCSFPDVAEDHWATEGIAAAAQAGLLEGYPDGTFHPGESLTRAEAVTAFNRMTRRCADENSFLKGMRTFSDNPEGTWYYAELQEAANSHTFVRSPKEDHGEVLPWEDWQTLLP